MNIRSLCNFSFSAAVFSAWWGAAQAATITASAPTAADVQAAINIAVDDDTVVVPAGSATWTTQVIIENKALILQGGGVGVTTITHNLSSNVPMLRGKNLGSKFLRITGFSFVGNLANTDYGIIGLDATKGKFNSNWRLDHLDLTGTFHRGILITGRSEGGLIDHCTLRNPANANAQGITIYGDAQIPLVPGNTAASFPPGTSWNRPISIGTSDMVFIEDCAVNFDYQNDAAIEGYYGSRYVVRHCTIINSLVGNHGLDSSVTSHHSCEVYDNIFVSTAYPINGAPGYNGIVFGTRGGTGVYFNNKYVVPWLSGPKSDQLMDHVIGFRCYRATGTQIISSYQGGFVTGSNPYDCNKAGEVAASGVTPTGWPTLEQVGTTGPITLFSDHSTCTLSPFYQWNNTIGVDANNQTRTQIVDIGPGTAARGAGINLVIDSIDNTTVTSATRNFAATDVDSWIRITAGAGFTPGWYRIVSTSSNAAKLSRSPGIAGSAGGTWTEYYVSIFPSDIIKANRDYYNNVAKPGYTAFVYPHPLVQNLPTPPAPRNLRIIP